MGTNDVRHVHNTPSSHSHDLKSILVTFQFSSVQPLKVVFSWGLLAYVGNFGMFQVEFFKLHIACRAHVQWAHSHVVSFLKWICWSVLWLKNNSIKVSWQIRWCDNGGSKYIQLLQEISIWRRRGRGATVTVCKGCGNKFFLFMHWVCIVFISWCIIGAQIKSKFRNYCKTKVNNLTIQIEITFVRVSSVQGCVSFMTE